MPSRRRHGIPEDRPLERLRQFELERGIPAGPGPVLPPTDTGEPEPTLEDAPREPGVEAQKDEPGIEGVPADSARGHDDGDAG